MKRLALLLLLGGCAHEPPPLTPADFGAVAAPPTIVVVAACRQWTKAQLSAVAKELAPIPAASPVWWMEHEWQALRDDAHCPPAK